MEQVRTDDDRVKSQTTRPAPRAAYRTALHRLQRQLQADSRLSGPARLVGAYILRLAALEPSLSLGYAYPSIEATARDTGMSEAAAKRHRRTLRDSGYFRVKVSKGRERGMGGRGQATRWWPKRPDSDVPLFYEAGDAEARQHGNEVNSILGDAGLDPGYYQLDFLDFWSKHPKAVDMARTAKAYADALDRGADPQAIVAAAEREAEHGGGWDYSWKWLRDSRYLDDLKPQKPKRLKGSKRKGRKAGARSRSRSGGKSGPTPAANAGSAAGRPDDRPDYAAVEGRKDAAALLSTVAPGVDPKGLPGWHVASAEALAAFIECLNRAKAVDSTLDRYRVENLWRQETAGR